MLPEVPDPGSDRVEGQFYTGSRSFFRVGSQRSAPLQSLQGGRPPVWSPGPALWPPQSCFRPSA